MDITGKQPIFFSRPADRSLAAYKNWMISAVEALGGTADNGMSEEEWEEAWRKFWNCPTPDKATPREEP